MRIVNLKKKKKVNKPSDFIFKTVAISKNNGATFYSRKKGENNDPEYSNDVNEVQWSLSVTVGSDIFNEMYTHIRNSLPQEVKKKLPESIEKVDGKYKLNDDQIKNLKEVLSSPQKCQVKKNEKNCECKAYIFLGVAEGDSNITHGNGYKLDVYIGEYFDLGGKSEGDGFIKRLNPSDTATSYKDLYKSKETWVIRNSNIMDDNVSHYHNGNCYYNQENDSPKYKINCGNKYYSHVHKVNGTWRHIKTGNPHKHTTQCWRMPPSISNSEIEKGTVVHDHKTIYNYEITHTSINQQPLLIVNDATTTVLKKELSLPLGGVPLKTDVTVHKYINSAGGKTGSAIEMKNGDAVGKANDCDYSDAIEEDRQSNNISSTCTYVEGSANRYQYKYEFISNPRVPDYKEERTALQTEDWKKEHPAVIEAGDSITYKIVLKNNTDKKVNVTVEDKLPENLTDTISEGILYIRRIDTNIGHNVYITSNDNYINSSPKVYIKDKTLHTRNFPDAKKINDEYYIEMDADEEITYSIMIHEISSAENSYDELNPVANTATITGIYRADVESDDEYYLAPIADKNKSSTVSRDYYLCKKYNVSVNSAITDMFRTGSGTTTGAQISTTEKVVDNKSYDFYDNKRLSINSSTRESNPLYMENGDCITYQIRLKDNATTSAPYYRPKKVKASVKVTKPTDTAEVVGTITSQDTTTKQGIGTITYNSTTEMLSDITIPAGREIIIWITFRINNNKTKTYDYNTLREVKASITKLTNKNGKTTTAQDGVAYCMMQGKCKDCRQSASSGKSCSYCYKVNNMDGIMDGLISNEGPILNYVDKYQASSSDYFRIKEYNIVVDKYISKVEHNPNRTNKSEPGTTFSAESRRIDIADPTTTVDTDGTVRFTNKGGGGTHSDEVYVEYGDVVTYKILVYNTTNDSNYNVGRTNAPYKAPQNVYVDVQDTLPNKYTDLKIDSNIHSHEPAKDNQNHKFEITDNNIPANSFGTITVTLVVDESTKDTIETNTVTISNWRNINGYSIINNGKRNTASDKYKLNDYNVTLDEYISTYNHEMMDYNNSNGFTSNEKSTLDDRLAKPKDTKSNNPLDVEKYETLTLSTKVTNRANGGEAESNSGSYAKYNTRVRPTDITQKIDYGLDMTGFTAIWYKADGKEENIISSITYTTTNDSNNKQKIYKYTITNEDIILSPGEYIIYYTNVKVSESNMYLGKLISRAEITTLTNINRNNSNTREVKNASYDQNIAVATNKWDHDYVRLKDLIIAGNVWLDSNKDGYFDNENRKK